MRDAGCFDYVGLVERVEAADVQVAGSGDAVDPAHCCSVLMLSLEGWRRGMMTFRPWLAKTLCMEWSLFVDNVYAFLVRNTTICNRSLVVPVLKPCLYLYKIVSWCVGDQRSSDVVRP